MPTLQILFVENQSFSREYILELAQNNDFDLQVAASCKQALNELQKKHFDLLLMDIEKSSSESFETTEFIRKNIPQASKLPIIFIASDENPQQEAQSLLYGANSVLKMPFSEKAFLAEIETLIH